MTLRGVGGFSLPSATTLSLGQNWCQGRHRQKLRAPEEGGEGMPINPIDPSYTFRV